jgi:3-phosphoshikimate 1-carboxyvinyltransferase
MNKILIIDNKIKSFNKKIFLEGDKSLSIRWALIASQAKGKSKSRNLLKSEDVLNTLNCLKKLGVKIKLKKTFCEIVGLGLNGYNYKKKIIIDAKNSGTLGRLLLGLLINSPFL